ncbi:PqqD family peptide modification chaperone [uncultured Thiodictyon sp.]|uniref:PqqD family peptide modification chaperone n=1 Tax=uncultured Thiodictyon sp. TaxID=1846217 RepID=UPI0025E70E61|nr:PqqD family peptide modification chaperone [uncultured Thiodictyon sp.]
MTTIDSTTPIIRHPDLVAAEMDGDLVMMSIAEGQYFGIGGVGPRIWELLERAVTVEELTATICDEFAVDQPTCRRDLMNFIQELLGMGLVQLA